MRRFPMTDPLQGAKRDKLTPETLMSAVQEKAMWPNYVGTVLNDVKAHADAWKADRARVEALEDAAARHWMGANTTEDNIMLNTLAGRVKARALAAGEVPDD
jgi:hypothetical protein